MHVGANKELAHRGPELFRAILEEFHPTTKEYLPNRQSEFTSAVQGSGENAISTYERLKYLAFRYGLCRGRPVSDEDLKLQFFMVIHRGAYRSGMNSLFKDISVEKTLPPAHLTYDQS